MRRTRALVLAACAAAGCAPAAEASEATLVVHAREAGRVYVDARPVAGTRVRVVRGAHVVELRRELPGGSALVIASEHVEVRGGATVDVVLDGVLSSDAGVSGRVEIRSVPPGASIEIDGALAGLGPLVVDLAPGPHTVRVSAPEHEPFEDTIHVGSGVAMELDVRLARAR